jgi:hypothetical protein
MFFSDPDLITLSAVRRTITKIVGREHIWDLMQVRECDRGWDEKERSVLLDFGNTMHNDRRGSS